MSLHEESLKYLCRKCGCKIKKDSHYQLKPVVIYKHTILSFITSDNQKVNPEYLCKSCYMVLYRLDLKTKNGFEVERGDKFISCINICKGKNEFYYLITNKFSDLKNFQIFK